MSNNTNFKQSYMLLGRLQMDCDYFLGCGGRCEKHLYYGNVEEHITEMKKLWNSLPTDGKPEWLTYEQIEEFEKEMTK